MGSIRQLGYTRRVLKKRGDGVKQHYWTGTNREHKTSSQKVRAQVVEVIDGDTFIIDRDIQGTRYIRIAGIDAPEEWQNGYNTAKNLLNRVIGGKWVLLDIKARKRRIIAEVYKNGKNIGKFLKIKYPYLFMPS